MHRNAFLAVGIYVTFFMYAGPGVIFSRAAGRPDLDVLLAPIGGAAGFPFKAEDRAAYVADLA